MMSRHRLRRPSLRSARPKGADDAEGMFQGYPGDHLYEAVDGVGFLLLALLYLETGRHPDMLGSGF